MQSNEPLGQEQLLEYFQKAIEPWNSDEVGLGNAGAISHEVQRLLVDPAAEPTIELVVGALLLVREAAPRVVKKLQGFANDMSHTPELFQFPDLLKLLDDASLDPESLPADSGFAENVAVQGLVATLQSTRERYEQREFQVGAGRIATKILTGNENLGREKLSRGDDALLAAATTELEPEVLAEKIASLSHKLEEHREKARTIGLKYEARHQTIDAIQSLAAELLQVSPESWLRVFQLSLEVSEGTVQRLPPGETPGELGKLFNAYRRLGTITEHELRESFATALAMKELPPIETSMQAALQDFLSRNTPKEAPFLSELTMTSGRLLRRFCGFINPLSHYDHYLAQHFDHEQGAKSTLHALRSLTQAVALHALEEQLPPFGAGYQEAP